MDPLSGVASVLAIIEAVYRVGKTAQNIASGLRNAPRELSQVKNDIGLLASDLKMVAQILSNAQATAMPQELLLAMQMALSQIHRDITSVQSICSDATAIVDTHPVDFRLRWMLKNKPKIATCAAGISTSRKRLLDLMQIVIFQGSIVSYVTLERLSNHVFSTPPLRATGSKSATTARNASISPAIPNWRQKLRLQYPGIRIIAASMQSGFYTDYEVTFESYLPFYYIVGYYMIQVKFGLRPFSSVGFGLCFARLLDVDHPFVRACEDGDLIRMREMLRSGEGRITDTTENGKSPFYVAIKHGRNALVKEFLDRGADLHGSVGPFGVSPLQLAIWAKQFDTVRLLLQLGATSDHADIEGWNALHYCWPILGHEQPMLEYLKLLREYDYLYIEEENYEHWTALHRAAVSGTSLEVEFLLSSGASHTKTSDPLGWTPIQFAIYHGNYDTFEALIPHCTVNDLRDDRGWSLLHIAAEGGSMNIATKLLQLGANPDALTDKFGSRDYMPETVLHRQCTPKEVARACIGKHYDAYLQALEAVGLATEDAADFVDAVEAQ